MGGSIHGPRSSQRSRVPELASKRAAQSGVRQGHPVTKETLPRARSVSRMGPERGDGNPFGLSDSQVFGSGRSPIGVAKHVRNGWVHDPVAESAPPPESILLQMEPGSSYASRTAACSASPERTPLGAQPGETGLRITTRLSPSMMKHIASRILHGPNHHIVFAHVDVETRPDRRGHRTIARLPRRSSIMSLVLPSRRAAGNDFAHHLISDVAHLWPSLGPPHRHMSSGPQRRSSAAGRTTAPPQFEDHRRAAAPAAPHHYACTPSAPIFAIILPRLRMS